jgi:hypothetical protein
MISLSAIAHYVESRRRGSPREYYLTGETAIRPPNGEMRKVKNENHSIDAHPHNLE